MTAVTGNNSSLSDITFGIQNCNTLNISTNCPTQVKKIAAILTLQASIIFLCDTRLNAGNVKVENFFAPTYDLFHNSQLSKRGVCILIKSTINYTVEQEHRDDKGNVLAMKLTINGTGILVVCIYGPNNNDDTFFETLSGILQLYVGVPIVIAGDWNLTYSTDSNDNNIDILNMASPPSVYRSRALASICEKYDLTDPYRALHPHKKDFTYIPRTGRNNRSRLDCIGCHYFSSPKLQYICLFRFISI
jgi:exonuclease III